WISMYGGEEFQTTVHDVLALTDRVGAELSEAETARVSEHFVTTSRYEWMFWDAGYRRESWPI
ncbi:MAG: thiaminase II, partial [Actinomycetota bacterium]|nr:thiaminase II [Actinomycetota bacterium]